MKVERVYRIPDTGIEIYQSRGFLAAKVGKRTIIIYQDENN